MKAQNRFFGVLAAVVAGFVLAGCGASKKVVYLQDIQANVPIMVQEAKSIRLQPGDKLSVVIHCRDKDIVEIFNLTDVIGGVESGHLLYTVDERGYIDMPVLGPMKVAGLSRLEVANMVKFRLLDSKMVRDPIVTVEYANMGYYFLGERAGRYELTRDNVTLLEALSEAGDLPISATRDNILVLRTENGQQTPYRVSLLKVEELYSSPVYYIQQNDIIYIEPILSKRGQANVHGNTFYTYGFWVSMVSMVASLVVLFVK